MIKHSYFEWHGEEEVKSFDSSQGQVQRLALIQYS